VNFTIEQLRQIMDLKNNIRSMSVIAHVDHGKTTLVDSLIKQSGMNIQMTDRLMDSNQLEMERGITILSKCTRIPYGDSVLNIVDTPGHADFGGEVERVMDMVDGVVLVVDACEGPKTQTKFVLQKALEQKRIRPIVVLNKVDRDQLRPEGEVENEIFDLFAELGASEEQLDYPTLYASGRNGFCVETLDAARSNPEPSMRALYNSLLERVQPPLEREVPPHVTEKDPKSLGFAFLVSQLDSIPGVGLLATGKVHSGRVKPGANMFIKNAQGEQTGQAKLKELFVTRGNKREAVQETAAGDIVTMVLVGQQPRWTDTVVTHPDLAPIPCKAIDPPVIAVTVSVNRSPLAGKDGKFITSLSIGERLAKEQLTNAAIEVEPSPTKDSFHLRGRGELQLSILLETMRREGFEMTLSPPTTIRKTDEDGTVLEPWEEVQMVLPTGHSAAIMERMGVVGGEMTSMTGDEKETSLAYIISSQNMLGIRGWIRDATGGTAVVSSRYLEHRKLGPPAPKTRKGVMISSAEGKSTNLDLGKAQRHGRLFIGADVDMYPGLIFGEHNKMGDIELNVSKKVTTNYQTAENLSPPARMNLEEVLSYIEDDEQVELTPNRITLRKKVLDSNERKQLAKQKAKAGG
jgi:GTP-binding protein